MPPAAIDDSEALARQAAEWLASLGDDDPEQRRHAAAGFAAWKAADPRHAQAAAGMERFLAQFEQVRQPSAGDARAAHAALQAGRAPARRVRRVVAGIALALALGWPAYSLWQAGTPALLMADLRTSGGQWEMHVLADGTRVSMQGGSAVDLHFDARRRALRLLRGDILVQVAKDAQRPFLVETAQGSIEALGTRFVVQQAGDVTTLAMLESRTRVRAAGQDGGDEGVVVTAGQGVQLDASGIGPIAPVDVRSIEQAWDARQLVVNDRPLAEVLEQLGRNRPGLIHYDRAQLAAIRVSAVLPLDDTDRALQLLKNNFPQLRIRRFSSWVVWVDLPAD